MSVGTPTPRTKPKPKPTIRDIAQAAGVSIATVSRALNGRPDVAPHTRTAVLEVVREQGYTTDRGPRTIVRVRNGLIGVTLPIIHAGYFSYLLSGLTEALYEQDMRAVICPTQHEHDREVSLLERLMHGTTDGAILILPFESSAELKALQRAGHLFVVIDPRESLDEGIASVSAANAAGARAATQHLLDLGHRRIAAITGPVGWMATEDRLTGYHAALAGARVMPDVSLEVTSDFEIGGGRAAAAQLFDLPEPPTGIFAFNDNLAVGAIQAATERGLRIPEDVSVVGFDDTEQSRIVTPALTSVRQPLAEMGRMAVSLLTRLLDGQRVDALRVELATKLVVRASTAPPRD